MSQARQEIGEYVSEFIAVLIIITIGNSASAMYALYDPSPYATSYFGVCIVWGLAVALAIYVTGAVSGTHANPAVTLALTLFRGFPARKVLPYWIAQVLGGLAGAAIVFQMFGPVIDAYNAAQGVSRADGGAAGVFFTHPGAHITPIRAFINEIILTAVLVLGIFAITEKFNTMAPQANLGALMIGLLVATIGGAAGNLEAWPLNPARDLGPRIFAYFAGWGESAFPSAGNYWWVPIAGPLCGGVLGAAIYRYLIYPFLPEAQRAQDDALPGPGGNS